MDRVSSDTWLLSLHDRGTLNYCCRQQPTVCACAMRVRVCARVLLRACVCVCVCACVVTSQQTTTRDFTCSVSEFTSSTGSIHVFSVREFTGFCRQIWCVDTCLLLVKSRVFPFVKNTCFLHVYSRDCRT